MKLLANETGERVSTAMLPHLFNHGRHDRAMRAVIIL
jgi:hypothetical protein